MRGDLQEDMQSIYSIYEAVDANVMRMDNPSMAVQG